METWPRFGFCVKLVDAQELGTRFWQTKSNAIVVHEKVPPECIFKIIAKSSKKALYERKRPLQPAPKVILRSRFLSEQQAESSSQKTSSIQQMQPCATVSSWRPVHSSNETKVSRWESSRRRSSWNYDFHFQQDRLKDRWRFWRSNLTRRKADERHIERWFRSWRRAKSTSERTQIKRTTFILRKWSKRFKTFSWWDSWTEQQPWSEWQKQPWEEQDWWTRKLMHAVNEAPDERKYKGDRSSILATVSLRSKVFLQFRI